MGYVHQCHDHIAQSRERLVDAAGFLKGTRFCNTLGEGTQCTISTLSLSPTVLASLCLSEPARSTRLSREVLILATDSLLSYRESGGER